MSALGAVLRLDGAAPDPAMALEIVSRLGLRGRDGVGSWCDATVALAVGHLATTVESGNSQHPFLDDESQVVVAADVRLDNRQELIALLGLTGDCSDDQIIAKSYARWGTGCVERFLGDFALVLWDAREQQLFLARDHLGIKPLVFASTPRCFYVASEVAALLHLPGVRVELDEGTLAEHLAGVLCSEHATVWKGVSRLGPAEAMTVRSGGVSRTWRYWEPDTESVIRYRNLAGYAEHWAWLFTDAVRCRLRSGGPVLMDLSGGLDSSSVVSVAALLQGQGEAVPGLHAASIMSSAEGADERAFAAAVMRRWPMDWLQDSDDEVLPTHDLADEARRVMDLGPWPDDLGGVGLMDRAQRIPGLRVQLTGQGGDFWCDGSGMTIADALARMNPKRVVRETRAWAASDRPDHLLSTFLKEGLAPLVASRLPTVVRSRRWRCPAGVTPGLADRTDLRERVAHRDDRLAGRRFRSPSQRARFAMVHDPMTQWGLLLDDRAGARRGIEERHPFHDRRLVEFSLLTPEWTRSSGGRTRRTQRRAMKAILPDEVRTRVGKAEFSYRFAGAFTDLLVPRLARGLRSAERGWVHPDVVGRQLQECLAASAWRPHCYPLAAVLGVELLLEAADDRAGSVQRNGAAAHG